MVPRASSSPPIKWMKYYMSMNCQAWTVIVDGLVVLGESSPLANDRASPFVFSTVEVLVIIEYFEKAKKHKLIYTANIYPRSEQLNPLHGASLLQNSCRIRGPCLQNKLISLR